ncbi:MAG: hypothetical protein JST33_15320 [Actinobacteria bacterium]|nr:hypothetical protein [Actinomycetota bacterium]
MPDEDQPAFEAGSAGSATAGGAQPGDERGFDASSLFVHEADTSMETMQYDDVGELFEHAITADLEAETPQDPDRDLHLHLLSATEPIETVEVHLFDEVESESRPQAHAFPVPAPAQPRQHHAAPFGMGRVQMIAMAAGLGVATLGVGWALVTLPAHPHVAAVPSPTVTIDPERLAKIDHSVDVLAAAVAAAQASADSFAAQLAAMVGSCDEPARLAADAARQAYVAALVAVKVPERSAETATIASLDQLERDVSTANASLTAASTAFRSAITTFRQSIPPFAATAVADNADAAPSFRTAATEAAAAAAAADPFGPSPFAAMDAWRNALAALVSDQARAVAAPGPSGSSGSTPGR